MTITQTHLDSIAHLLDIDAREAAHAACYADTTAEQFAEIYLRCLAIECREAAMEQLGSDEEWSPADWLPGDSDLISEHAELLGVEPDWSKLWEIYAPEYAGADIYVSTSRDSIDSQGLCDDETVERCAQHIVNRLRAEFDGAEVREVTTSWSGGTRRSGESISAEVRAAVNRAFDSFSW
jgi:hypothetical protein